MLNKERIPNSSDSSLLLLSADKDMTQIRKESLKSWKLQTVFLLFFVLVGSFKSVAQNIGSTDSNQYFKIISFGEKIDFENIDQTITWTVSNAKNNIYTTLRGNEINDYVFQEPGEYEINFQENKPHDEECHHPQFAERFKIKVEPVRMSFDFSKITFSEKIERGRNYTDLIITVPAEITTKDNSITKLSVPKMSVAGLGVSFTVEALEKEIVIGNKTQLLKYKLSGVVNQETYLMFDFYDFNNQAQTFNFHQIIK
ncbi:hypothetical protein NYQ10_21145 [Flavobacterium johnsoniae]|uniref:hypothetical protein n=1 Tax=Flavobacterium johnsoniae TaxID=986 RepID=UPI0025B13D4B|nr:hypothetical protein [Flavobacterium johnsoniae]WJS94591.1 hypothetical protein NYQ10_21145 [Flavobacterium johnsoniae]